MFGFGRNIGLNTRLPAIISGSSPPSPMLPSPIGVIYSGSDLSDWVVPGVFTGTVDISQDAGTILMSGTGGTGGVNASNLFQDFILLNTSAHKFTGLSKWKMTIDFETQSSAFDANSFGFSCGVVSANNFEFRDALCRFRQDTGAAGDLGRLYFYYTDTSAVGITNQEQPAGGYTPSTSTRYIQVFEKDDLVLTCTIYDETGTIVRNTKTIDNSPPGGTVNRVHHNTGRFAICQHGGTNRIHNITIESDALKNVPYCGLGDSHFYGGKSSTLAGSMFHSAMSGLDYTICPGWADRAQDMLLRFPEILAINPGVLMIECGSNDIKDTTWASDGYPAFQSMVSQAQAAGITVYGMSAPARNDVDVTQVQTDMNTTLGMANVYQAFSDTKQPANTDLLGPYDSGDGIHGDDDMHPVCATGIKNIIGI